LVFDFLSFLYIWILIPLPDEYLAKIFFHSMCCLFILVIVSFVVQKLFNPTCQFLLSFLELLEVTQKAVAMLTSYGAFPTVVPSHIKVADPF
jgi:hypothetical protein